MFETYDTKEFGAYIKNIRVSLGLSQDKVARQTKLSTETLRKIENGLVVPRLDTLEYLSRAYKTDVLKVLGRFRVSHILIKLYEHIDQVILNYSIEKIRVLDDMVKEIKSNTQICQLIEPNDIHQVQHMIEGISAFYQNQHQYALDRFSDGLKISMGQFSTENFQKHFYSLFESRLLLMISMCYAALKDFSIANNMLTFTLDLITHNEITCRETMRLVTKIYFNLAYNSHTENRLDEVISYTSKGIELCQQNESMYLLHGLYYRRGIAKYLSNKNDYLEDLNNAILLLKLTGKEDLVQLYKDKTSTIYQIDL